LVPEIPGVGSLKNFLNTLTVQDKVIDPSAGAAVALREFLKESGSEAEVIAASFKKPVDEALNRDIRELEKLKYLELDFEKATAAILTQHGLKDAALVIDVVGLGQYANNLNVVVRNMHQMARKEGLVSVTMIESDITHVQGWLTSYTKEIKINSIYDGRGRAITFADWFGAMQGLELVAVKRVQINPYEFGYTYLLRKTSENLVAPRLNLLNEPTGIPPIRVFEMQEFTQP